jgi:hypothetical protein
LRQLRRLAYRLARGLRTVSADNDRLEHPRRS